MSHPAASLSENPDVKNHLDDTQIFTPIWFYTDASSRYPVKIEFCSMLSNVRRWKRKKKKKETMDQRKKRKREGNNGHPA